MEYKFEKIVNIGELEKILCDAYVTTQNLIAEIKKGTPNPQVIECFVDVLNSKLTVAKDFEFRIEIRKVTE